MTTYTLRHIAIPALAALFLAMGPGMPRAAGAYDDEDEIRAKVRATAVSHVHQVAGVHRHVVVVRRPAYPYDPFWASGYQGAYGPYGAFAYNPWGYYGTLIPTRVETRIVPVNKAAVALDVHPGKALVTIDGTTVGRARDHDDIDEALWLTPGRHLVELSADGRQTLRIAVDVEGGRAYDLRYELSKG